MHHTIDLSAVSIIIPFRCDSEDRYKNLQTVLRYFTEYFDNADIIVVEHSENSHVKSLAETGSFRHCFLHSEGYFHKTRVINKGVAVSDRDIIVVYDVDTFLTPEVFQHALIHVQLKESPPFVIPFSGICLNIESELKDVFIHSLDFSVLPTLDSATPGKYVAPDVFCMHHLSTGGIMFFKRQGLMDAGGYNERFISWGWEDDEIILRFQTLGLTPYRVPKGNIYHLDHPRGINSQEKQPFYHHNYREYKYVKSLSKSALQVYIDRYLRPDFMVHIPLKRFPFLGKNAFHIDDHIISDVVCPHCELRFDIDCVEY